MCHGQESGRQTAPAFEAVAVKRSGTTAYVMHGPGSVTAGGFGFRYSGVRVACDLELRAIIREAFSIKEDYQVAGPSWIATERYQVNAVLPAGTSRDMARLMLRTMLEERFGLRYHHEQKDLPGYALIEARSGFKLRPVDPAQAKERVFETPLGPKQGFGYVS